MVVRTWLVHTDGSRQIAGRHNETVFLVFQFVQLGQQGVDNL